MLLNGVASFHCAGTRDLEYEIMGECDVKEPGAVDCTQGEWLLRVMRTLISPSPPTWTPLSNLLKQYEKEETNFVLSQATALLLNRMPPTKNYYTRARWKALDLVYVKLGTSGRWVGTRTRAGVTATLRVWWSFVLVAAHGFMGIGGCIRGTGFGVTATLRVW